MSDRDQLYSLREMHLNALKMIRNDINNEETFLAFTAADLTVRAELLRSHYEKMEKAHTLYRQCAMLSSDKVYIKAQRDFMSSLAKLETRIKELNREEQSRFQPTANSTMGMPEQPVHRTEPTRKPQIGKFNGSAADWPGFRDVFLAEVDRRDYEPVMKLIYLRDACTDKAARILGTWQLVAANYQLAWDSMMHAFNDEYQVIHGIMTDMYGIRQSERESIDDMQEILNVLNNSRRQLQSMMTPQQLEEQLFIHYATARMAPATQDAWEQFRNRDKSSGLTSLDEMKQFLHHKTRMHTRAVKAKVGPSPRSADDRGKRSNHEGASKTATGNSRAKPYDRNKPSNDGDKRDSHGFGPPSACIMNDCDQVHYLGQCQAFRNLTIAEKMTVVKEHQLCRCCLMAGHMSTTCKKRGCSNCPDAKIKHHYHLCSKNVKSESTKKETSTTASSKP